MSAIPKMSPPTGVINLWFPNGVTPPSQGGEPGRKIRRGTQGTETSQYLQEKKSYEIP